MTLTNTTNNSQNREFALENIDNTSLGTNQNEGLQQAVNLVKNHNILKNLTNNHIGGVNSNTYQELQQINSSLPGVIDNFKAKFISKLENEKVQNIIKDTSNEFGKRLGILGNAFLINDNPFADVFFSLKSIFDLVLYEFFNILLFINIIILNIDETVAINSFNSNIKRSNIIDNFLFSMISTVKTFSENILQSLTKEAFAIIFKYSKTDEKTVDLITNLSTEILHNTIHNFFEIFYKNLNSRTSAKGPVAVESMNPKMIGGKLRKLKTKKQKILKRITAYLANFHNTNHKYKSKTLKRSR